MTDTDPPSGKLPKIRLCVPDGLAAGAVFPLASDQVHYLVNVMRLRAGDQVRVFNGRDGEWLAELTSVSKKAASLSCVALHKPQAGVPDLWLLFAPVKKVRLDFLVQKATELGVARLQPVYTARTVAERVNLERMAANAAEAAEQTGRMCVPEIAAPEKLETVLTAWDSGRALLFCDEAGDDLDAEWGGVTGRAQPIDAALHGAERGRPWAVLIGPEGGFDAQERAALRAHVAVVPVTLGPRILRADTAAVSALSIWQSVLGDWG